MTLGLAIFSIGIMMLICIRLSAPQIQWMDEVEQGKFGIIILFALILIVAGFAGHVADVAGTL